MTNINLLITEDMSELEIAEAISRKATTPDEHFILSGIQIGNKLKLNCADYSSPKLFTPKEFAASLLSTEMRDNKVRYVQPTLDEWLIVFKPMIDSMVYKASQLHPSTEQSEILSYLYMTIIKLHRKKYYLHRTLIWKSLINELNAVYRKKQIETISLFTPIKVDDKEKSLVDTVADPSANFTEFTLDQYWQEMFETIKTEMLTHMSQFGFDMFMQRLSARTIDTTTSRELQKLREKFNPGYHPRGGK